MQRTEAALRGGAAAAEKSLPPTLDGGGPALTRSPSVGGKGLQGSLAGFDLARAFHTLTVAETPNYQQVSAKRRSRRSDAYDADSE